MIDGPYFRMICDKCERSEEFYYEGDETEHFDYLDRLGWSLEPTSDGKYKDLCPSCASALRGVQ